jgi:hypothetical protein
MTTLSPKKSRSSVDTLRSTIFSILDAKIKYADFQLNNYAKSLLKEGQTPSRANNNDNLATIANEKIFSFIENSSLQTTKLLYLRANLNKWNCKKILYLLTQNLIKTMSLEEIKEEIKEAFKEEVH